MEGSVAPFAGAWIEIYGQNSLSDSVHKVAPFAGAWIEIAFLLALSFAVSVAPFAGAWIEIFKKSMQFIKPNVSLVGRERGSKYKTHH